MNSVISNISTPIFDFIKVILSSVGFISISFLLTFFIVFFSKLKCNPLWFFSKKHRLEFFIRLHLTPLFFTPFNLFRFIFYDFLTKDCHNHEFKDFGFSFYVGRQGAGKTISMVEYLSRMRKNYPNCIIVTNFKCIYSDFIMKDWHDILNIRNDTNGVIFAIDEIHSEYSSSAWKDVPENLLSEISQQRKQRVKIIASAQYYCRIAKPLREQGFTVVACSTRFKGRQTTCRVYDAELYSSSIENGTIKGKLKPFQKYSFVQDDELRNSYDTYEKINLMQKIKFIPRHER